MKDYKSLNHTKWDCKYHVVFIPKMRKKKIFGGLRKYLGDIFHELAKQKECEIVEGHLKKDHIHICISIPPKFAVSSIVGFLNPSSPFYGELGALAWVAKILSSLHFLMASIFLGRANGDKLRSL